MAGDKSLIRSFVEQIAPRIDNFFKGLEDKFEEGDWDDTQVAMETMQMVIQLIKEIESPLPVQIKAELVEQYMRLKKEALFQENLDALDEIITSHKNK